MDVPANTALVTGGGGSIGTAVCTSLARRNVDVAIVDVDDDAMTQARASVERHGQRVACFRTDVGRPAEVRDTVDAALESFGAIDILVNVAGVPGPTSRIEDVTDEQWEETLATNLWGPFLFARELLGNMRSRGYGRIVNVASTAAKRPVPERAPYTASKSGLLGLTRTIAAEGGKDDVNANAICPGPVTGPLIEHVVEAEAAAAGRPAADVESEKREGSLRGEFVAPEDVAETVVFLCSDGADRITGQTINVTAGKVTY